MTLTNEERAERSRDAACRYSDDDPEINLIDFLADAMHWCRIDGLPFQMMLEAAAANFHAEIARVPEAPVGEGIVP